MRVACLAQIRTSYRLDIQDRNMRNCLGTSELAVSAESEDRAGHEQNLVQLTDQNLVQLTIRT